MTAAPTGTLIHLDPATIATDKNIRDDLQLTPQWIKNLEQHGVQTPISAYWDPTLEQYQVERGHRRTVGAVQAGLTTIPVYVIDKPAEDTDRITDQLVENIQRAPLRDTEEASAYRQLSFAMPAMQIAQRTNAKLARVGDSLKVTRSPVATKALAEHQLTIEDALVFAEFDDDADAIADLTDTVLDDPTKLRHAAQLLRDARALEESRLAIIADLNSNGIRILDKVPSWDDRTNLAITSLYTNDKDYIRVDLKDVPAEHLAAAARTTWTWDPTSGRRTESYEACYIVTDYPTLGYHNSQLGRGTTKGPLTDAEKADRRQARENAKLWVSATTVRLAWVKELLERRGLPKDAPALAALWIAKMDGAPHRGPGIARGLLGVEISAKDYGSFTALQKFAIASPDQGLHVILAVAIAAIEGSLDEKKGWEGGYTGLLPYYLKQLAAWGYPLSDIEEGIVKKHDVEQARKAKTAAA